MKPSLHVGLSQVSRSVDRRMTSDAVVLAEVVIPMNGPVNLVADDELEVFPGCHRLGHSEDKRESVRFAVTRIVNV
jgi:hypothetical protein